MPGLSPIANHPWPFPTGTYHHSAYKRFITVRSGQSELPGRFLYHYDSLVLSPGFAFLLFMPERVFDFQLSTQFFMLHFAIMTPMSRTQ